MVRTVLCVEPRNGTLYVFLPPLTRLEHYLDLVARIEVTAAELGMPVVIEGYEPPRDPRLVRLLVTPDPGVIEVNIHPAHGWRELVDIHSIVYEEPRNARLGTEKFMVDGPATRTGGSNRVTIGGPSGPTARSCAGRTSAQPGHLLAAPSDSRICSGLFWTDQSPRRRRRATTPLRLELARRARRARAAAAGSSTVCSGNLLIDVTATRTAPSSASTSSTRRTVRRDASAWSRCAPSRCRRIRV